MKKKLLVVSSIIAATLVTGCIKDDSEELPDFSKGSSVEDTSDTYTTFYSLDKEYKEGKDINTFAEDDVIMDKDTYEPGEYKEVDFALDFVNMYLSGNEDIYQYMMTRDDDCNLISISNEDQERLENSLSSLKTQMSIEEENPIYFTLKNIVYEGKYNGDAYLKVNGFISATEDYYESAMPFHIIVYEKDDKLYGEITS